MLPKKRLLSIVLLCGLGALSLMLAGLYHYAGMYGLNVLLRRGGSYWISVNPNDARLSASMRTALLQQPLRATPGPFEWREIERGFEVAELPVLVSGTEVDRILLARIDPSAFRFVVRNAPAGNKELDDWVRELGAALVINGSYYASQGTPATPVMSDGTLLGPSNYDAKHAAFVAAPAFASIRDLANQSWRDALAGTSDAMVSYPLLVVPGGSNRVVADRVGWPTGAS